MWIFVIYKVEKINHVWEFEICVPSSNEKLSKHANNVTSFACIDPDTR